MADFLSLFAFWAFSAPLALALGALGWYAARRAKPLLALWAPAVALVTLVVVDLLSGSGISAPNVRLVLLNVLIAVLVIIPVALPTALLIWYGARRPLRPWVAGALTTVLAYLLSPLSLLVALFASCALLKECL